MKSRAVQEKSFEFALRIIKCSKHLRTHEKEYVLSKQLLRSGTAIGALVREADYAESKADFIHKVAIALKEAAETEYWILLLKESGYLEETASDSLLSDLTQLLKLLTAIIKTARANQ